MSKRVFALLIGISKYKSATISNLRSCTEDSKRIRNWLVTDLNVPMEQICLLQDREATKQHIEDAFMEHLMNNSSIERGDVIIFYFAGHGSCLPSPSGWFQGDDDGGVVHVLCPHDYDTKSPYGRNAGISDRSFNAILNDLVSVKGDNVTVILDCCFSPAEMTPGTRNSRSVRWTRTTNAIPDDLYHSLWVGARGKDHLSSGFFDPLSRYMILAACPSGGKALEYKIGGHFTTRFLQAAACLPLHRTSYAQLIDHLRNEVGDFDQYLCVGANQHRSFFNEIPFVVDTRFFPACLNHGVQSLRLAVGAIHGITVGTELSLHLHNRSFSFNRPIALCSASDVQPTYTSAGCVTSTSHIPQSCWAKVVKWNNPLPLRIYLKASFKLLLRSAELTSAFSIKGATGSSRSGIKVLQIKQEISADISFRLRPKSLRVKVVKMLSQMEDNVAEITNKPVVQAVDDAAKFRFHLARKNSASPFRNLIDMEVSQLNLASSSQISENLLEEGVAIIPYQRGDFYSVKLRNNSHFDIWPYLVYMDPKCHSITLLYTPGVSDREAPLSSHGGTIEIGPDKFQPGTIPFPSDFSKATRVRSAYLKLFFSSAPVYLEMLEQNPTLQHRSAESTGEIMPCIPSSEVIWDAALASLVFVPRSEDEDTST